MYAALVKGKGKGVNLYSTSRVQRLYCAFHH